jgi:ligand-binding SRPBCC domain-containing protein
MSSEASAVGKRALAGWIYGRGGIQLWGTRSGPYCRWEHTHRLRRVDGGTEIYDHVVYRLPYEPLAGLLAPVTVRPWLTAIFDYRAHQTKARLR